MTPEQFTHCRKSILKLDQNQLADMLGLHFRQVHRYERGITKIPSRITFAMAWIAMHGTHNPWARDEAAAHSLKTHAEQRHSRQPQRRIAVPAL